MANLGKRTEAIRQDVDRTKLYPLEDAVKMVKERAKAKFDETIEVAMNLGVDPRHADQMVRGIVNLPNGSGRSVRVAVFARGAKADEAKAAGADVVGAEDLVEKVQAGALSSRFAHLPSVALRFVFACACGALTQRSAGPRVHPLQSLRLPPAT